MFLWKPHMGTAGLEPGRMHDWLYPLRIQLHFNIYFMGMRLLDFYLRNFISDILFQTWGHIIECMKTNTTRYFLWYHVHRFSISEILLQVFYFRHEATPLSITKWSGLCLSHLYTRASGLSPARAGALVHWLKLPAWKVGDLGFEHHSSRKQNVFSRALVKIQYFGEPPWPRGSVFGLIPPGLEFRILCLEGSVRCSL